MRGHVRERGKGWAFVVDVDGQRARRCVDCGRRVWVDRESPAACPACAGELGEAKVERRQVWRSFTTRKAAENALTDFMAETRKGVDPFPEDIDLWSWVDRWKTSPAYTKLRPRTRARYAQVLTDWWLAHLGTMRVDRIRPRHVREVLDAMSAAEASPRSVTEAKAILSSTLARAVDVGLIDANPCAGVRTEGGRKHRYVVPDADQARQLLEAVEGGTWEVPLALAAYTGMRRSEVLGLRWADVDLDARTIRVTQGLHAIRDDDGSRLGFLPTKTETSDRQFMIGETLAARLRQWKREQAERRLSIASAWQDVDLVCDRGDGGPLHPDSFSSGFRRACVQAGMPAGMRLHDVRHSVATTLLAQGVDAKVVSAMLGHSTVSFTQDQYQHVLKGMTSAAADALDQAMGG